MPSGHKKSSNFYKHGRLNDVHIDNNDKISVRENAKSIILKDQSKLPRKEVKRIKK